MFQINNKFIGYNHNYRVSAFAAGGDTKDNFLKNLKSQPQDWYYRTAKISYIRNSLGHRSSEISDIDLDNYILTTGCSLTEGIGLELDRCYPAHLSKLMNCDYYNLAISGSGLDILNYNLLTWFFTVPKRPKLIVVQVPEITRFLTVNADEIVTHVPMGVGEYQHHKFMAIGDEIQYWQSRYQVYKNLWQSAFNTPIVEINANYDTLMPNQFFFDPTDRARDLAHFGIQTHSDIAHKIFEHIKDKL
jgi:hypothetical protein